VESKSSIPFSNQRDEKKSRKAQRVRPRCRAPRALKKLRHAETEKLLSGRRYFEAWDVDFSVVKSAGEMEWLQGSPSFACL